MAIPFVTVSVFGKNTTAGSLDDSYTTIGSLDNNVTSTAVVAPAGCRVFAFSQYTPWNNPEDLVSHETQQRYKTIIDVYFLTFFFLLAVPSNVVNMVVFWKHGIKERINLCLFCLAFADFVIVFSHFEWKLDRLYSEVTNTPYKIVIAKYNIDNMIHSLAGFIYISGFMTTLIAFERCLCIVSPLKAQSIIQTKASAAIILVGHVLILGGQFVIATKWSIVCMFDPFVRKSKNVAYSSDFYINNKTLVSIFEGIIFGILLPGFCVTGVTVSTCVTVVKIRQMKQWREQATSASTGQDTTAHKDLSLTRMLIGTNALFVVCTTPPLIFHTVLPFIPELGLSGKYYNTFDMLITTQQLCTYINSSVNFFVYYFFGTKFQRTVQGMLCRPTCCTNESGEKRTKLSQTM